MSLSEVVTVRLTPEIKSKLEALSHSTRRTKSWLAAEAITLYVEQQIWQIEMIEQAVTLADNDNAKWIDGDKVEAWLDSWGTEDEKHTPCA